MSDWKEYTAKIKSNLKVEGDTIVLKEEGNNDYLNLLPEGITKADVKLVEQHQSDYITATAAAVTELAGDAFVKDKKLEAITTSLPFSSGRGNVGVKVERSREFNNPVTGEKIVKPNVVVAVKFAGVKVTKSILQSLKKDLQSKL